MNNQFSPLVVLRVALSFFATFLLSSVVQATSLGQFDARSLAMGGAGVAGAESANAAAYNPALMATPSNKKSFSIIPLVLKVEAVDENDFIDTVDATDESISGEGGLNELLDGLTLTENCPSDSPPPTNIPNCFQDPGMITAAQKSNEVFGYVTDLNKSNALVNINSGIAIQLGKSIPMAFIVDGGTDLRIGVKFASSDFKELNAYSDVMADGEITATEFGDLEALGLVENTPGQLNFVRGGDDGKELQSLIEITGAAYYEFGISFADSFQYLGKDLAVGITPKLVRVGTIKFHHGLEQDADDIGGDDIFDENNMVTKTDFNADVGIIFKPFDSQPLQAGLTIKNLFTRTYAMKKTPTEIAIETAANGGDADAIADLASFNFKQSIKIEPQITAGFAYDLRFFNLLADIDLNAAEVLGRTSQHMAVGAEFDVRVLRIQAGYRTSIGGDDEEDAISAGFSVGPVGVAGVFANDNIGGVIQFGMSF